MNSEDPASHDTPEIDRTPRARLLAVFDRSCRGQLRGCPFHNAAVETPSDRVRASSPPQRFIPTTGVNVDEQADATTTARPATRRIAYEAAPWNLSSTATAPWAHAQAAQIIR